MTRSLTKMSIAVLMIMLFALPIVTACDGADDGAEDFVNAPTPSSNPTPMLIVTSSPTMNNRYSVQSGISAIISGNKQVAAKSIQHIPLQPVNSDVGWKKILKRNSSKTQSIFESS